MLTYKWIDLNTDFERKYGMKKDISKPVADEDMTTLLEFIGDEGTDEDERYLANHWLAKFNRYRDKNPRAEDSKPKRKVVPIDRLKANAAGPQIKASKAKVCGVYFNFYILILFLIFIIIIYYCYRSRFQVEIKNQYLIEPKV